MFQATWDEVIFVLKCMSCKSTFGAAREEELDYSLLTDHTSWTQITVMIIK